MENSLKGILVTVTVVGLFITCILNWIIIFPQEQGVVFNDAQSHAAFLTINSTNTDVTPELSNFNNQSSSAFNQWDVTQGFMGTNQLKQGQSGIKTYTTNIFTNLIIIATELFGANSPILYALAVFSTLTTGYLIYQVILFIRSGR